MGIIEVLNNWLEERKVKSEKRRLDKQDLRLKKLQSKENIRIKKLELQNQKAEQARILKEVAIKASEAIKIKKFEARTEKSKSNASKPGFFENLSLLWEKRGERRKVIKLAKIEKEKAAKIANVGKPTFWDKLFDLLKPKTSAIPPTTTTSTTSPLRRKSRIGSYSLLFMLACFAVVYYSYKQQPEKQERISVAIDEEVEQNRLTSIDNSNGHLHHSGKKVIIGESGYLYERTPGWSYSESTEDHLIYIPNGTNEKYFKGPNGWESEYPNKGEVRALTRPTDEILVYPNKNYGGSKFTLKIVKIVPQSPRI